MCQHDVLEESGLTITAEVRYPDGEHQKISINTNKWDANGDDMGGFLRQLLAGLGYTEKTIREIFCDDCEVYQELLPDQEVREEIPYYPPMPTDLACLSCDTACEDTACLHEKRFDER
jgi:hypothetical protein